MRITDIWFEGDHLYGRDENGGVHRQSLLWYPCLRKASESQRLNYTVGYDGFHWRHLDEDVSFESFYYEDAEPSVMQKFFLTHPEVNLSELAKSIGVRLTLLRNYINGMKKPSKECEQSILRQLKDMGFDVA